jgi:spore maturation protein CgeB
MKILLTLNKTLKNRDATWIDGGYWNFYLPLQKLGHEVYLYDTVDPEEKDYSKVVENFKPDLIFCCFTNNERMTPYEPWEEIQHYTQQGNIKTFNWFCDDVWRFEDFSKRVCHYFTACSTPEVRYLEKFEKEANYKNIILGLWHANIDLYPAEKIEKKYDVSFCGHLNYDRTTYINFLTKNGINIEHFHGLEHKDMLRTLAETHIGINFSKNFNGNPPALQIKGRMFEVPAAKSLLLTEYTEGLEHHFAIDKEVITFSDITEMYEKTKYLLKHPSVVAKIAENGYKRFIKDHESKIRLQNIIEKIDKI